MGNHEKRNIFRMFFPWMWREFKQLILITSAGLPAILAYEFLLSPHQAENVHHITNML